MPTRRRLLAQMLAVALSGGSSAFAQDTKRLLRLIVGFPAGGGTDIIARLRAKAHAAGVDLSQPFFFPPEHERFSQIITEFKQEREARIARLRRNKNKLRRHQALMSRQDIKAVARVEGSSAI